MDVPGRSLKPCSYSQGAYVQFHVGNRRRHVDIAPYFKPYNAKYFCINY